MLYIDRVEDNTYSLKWLIRSRPYIRTPALGVLKFTILVDPSYKYKYLSKTSFNTDKFTCYMLHESDLKGGTSFIHLRFHLYSCQHARCSWSYATLRYLNQLICDGILHFNIQKSCQHKYFAFHINKLLT